MAAGKIGDFWVLFNSKIEFLQSQNGHIIDSLVSLFSSYILSMFNNPHPGDIVRKKTEVSLHIWNVEF